MNNDFNSWVEEEIEKWEEFKQGDNFDKKYCEGIIDGLKVSLEEYKFQKSKDEASSKWNTYSDRDILDFIEKVSVQYCNSEKPTYKDFEMHGDCSMSTVERRFGSWSSALKKAGYDSNRILQKNLIEEMERVSEEYCEGSSPRIVDMNSHGKYHPSTYQSSFGSWNEALIRCGFDLNSKSYSDKEVIEEMNRISNSDLLSRQKFSKESPMAVQTVINHFSSWSNALEAAELNDFEEIVDGKNVYGDSWTDDLRESIRNRDGNTCRICGLSSSECLQEYGNDLHIHHIKKVEKWNTREEHEEMNYPSNLISLCNSCHRKLEGKWEDAAVNEFENKAKEYLDIEG